ncbi:hypothetical protein C0992_003686, partial [Termitomyces sp. T32_za158]
MDQTTTSNYFESLYSIYTTATLPTDLASTIFEDALLKFHDLQTKANQSQNVILQTFGVGKEWNWAEEVLRRIKAI